MRLLSFRANGASGIAVRRGADVIPFASISADIPNDLLTLLRCGKEAIQYAEALVKAGKGTPIDPAGITYLPTIPSPSKIMCVGLNYADHAAETGMATPQYPVLFPRFSSTLIGHDQPLIKPRVSDHFDYEVELVAVIGRKARAVPKEKALEFVAGYSVFNDASVRDYQFKTTQFTQGKNFDATGAYGPDFVTADELPPGGAGLKIAARLNGDTVQSSSTSHLIFDVATLVSLLSEFMTLNPGDTIVTGTPGGVGYTRNPPLFMKDGDVCECEVEGVGVLRNPVVNEL